MAIITKRPTTSLATTAGNWALTPSTGATVDQILSDNSTATFLSTTLKSQLPSQFAVFDIEDFVLPDGAKIFSVGIRVNVFQSAPATSGPQYGSIIQFFGQFLEEVIEESIEGDIARLLATIFGFGAPRIPTGGTAAWQVVQQAFYTEKPSGGEWTLAVLNGLLWRLGRSDGNGLTSKVAEFYVDCDYNQAPTVAISGPLVDVTGTTRPIITFDYDDYEGDLQEAFQAKVFNSAQYSAVGFNFETSTPFTSIDWKVTQDSQWIVNRDLPNDDYRVYLQVRQVWKGLGMHVSAWDVLDFTMDVDGPPPPVITATPNNTVNWVQLALTATAGTYDTETYNIYYSDNSGVDWDLVRGGYQLPADASGNASLVDYEAPLNQGRWYYALAYRTLSGVKIASDPSEIVIAVPGAQGWWLKDVLAPSLNMRVRVLGDKPTRKRPFAVFRPLVADGYEAFVVTVKGPRYGIEGETAMAFIGPDDESGWDRFNAIYNPGRTLLWQFPTGEQHYVQLSGDVPQDWAPRDTDVHYRLPTVGYFEVVRPPDPDAPST